MSPGFSVVREQERAGLWVWWTRRADLRGPADLRRHEFKAGCEAGDGALCGRLTVAD